MKLKDIDLLAIGNTSLLAGVIYTGQPNIIFWLPGEERERKDMGIDMVEMDENDWKTFLDQTDNARTEVSVGNEKAILRKCLRAIDQNISWKVYARDGYKCRYCGRTGIPLTVDHVDLWENGGATIEENLISACKKDNKNRGNMSYEDWLQSASYQQASVNLTQAEKDINTEVLTRLPSLVTLRVKTIKSR